MTVTTFKNWYLIHKWTSLVCTIFLLLLCLTGLPLIFREELAVWLGEAVEALEGRKACLLEHHGIIAVGATLSKALWLSVEVETLAKQYHGALQLGEPRLLSKEEIARVLEKMGSYGHKD